MVLEESKSTASDESDTTTTQVQSKSRTDVYNEIIQARYDKNKELKGRKKKERDHESAKMGAKQYNVWMMQAAQELAKKYASSGEDPPPPLGEPYKYDPETRNDFVKAVFRILFVMLALTSAFLIAVFSYPELKQFYLSVPIFILIAAMITMVSLNYILFCVPSARVGCCSYVCLLVAVIAMSNLAAAITVRYRTHVVAYAFLATTVTVFVCILLACSSFDFTKFYIFVIAAAVVFMVVAALIGVAMIVYKVRYRTVDLVLLFVGALLNVAFLIMELQMVLGGRSVELTEREHAFGAYLLYTSIVDMFLRLVQIMGMLSED